MNSEDMRFKKGISGIITGILKNAENNIVFTCIMLRMANEFMMTMMTKSDIHYFS